MCVGRKPDKEQRGADICLHRVALSFVINQARRIKSMSPLLLYAFLALVMPYAIFRWYGGLTRTVYHGTATVSTVSLLDRNRRSVANYDILPVILPDGSHMILEQAKAKLASLRDIAYQPVITVKQSLFGGRYISDVLWPGDKAATAGDTKNQGVYLSVIYFLLGFLAVGIAAGHAVFAQFGLFGFAYAALLLAVGGMVLGRDQFKAGTKVEGVKLLGLIPIGQGKVGVLAGCALATLATAACFYGAGLALAAGTAAGISAFVLVLVGMSLAFSLGMLGALATR
jgi:hypothetical protein